MFSRFRSLRMQKLPDFLFPNAMDSEFNMNNLPYGVFRKKGTNDVGRIGVAIGDKILNLHGLVQRDILHKSLGNSVLNEFMAQSPKLWDDTRSKISAILSSRFACGEKAQEEANRLYNPIFYEQRECEMLLPVNIGDYTDFYASEEHATNVGEMFRGKQNALMPNWKTLPVGYHGRASSVVVSGTDIRRPKGLFKKGEALVFGPSEELDFELELACFVGGSSDGINADINSLGDPIPLDKADSHIFGYVLMNDWSARDIQRWEYQPLGPFLGKNFGTTISPWIVTHSALKPFMTKIKHHEYEPAEYLRYRKNNCDYKSINAALDLDLEVFINGTRVTKSNPKYLYWSFPQMIAHHTVNGCNLRAGDLLGSGTISGPDRTSMGSLLELTWNKTKPLEGIDRTYIEDGDKVTITGKTSRTNNEETITIGFGSCEGVVIA